jgi:glycosyltransferase involved in cell wall biosynthesis
MPIVSIVIPTRDRWSWLGEALHSAASQKGVTTEVIVVDDGSSEDPPLPLDEHGARVKVLRLPVNGGVAAARNRGSAEARGDWIAFLDDDDYWAPDHLATLIDRCTEENADFAYSASWVVDERRRALWFRPAPAPGELSHQLHLKNAIGTPSGVIVSTAFWRATGGFDERLAAMADWDLWLRWAAIGQAATTHAPTLAYTEHPANMSLDMRLLLKEFKTLQARYSEGASGRQGPLGGDGFPRWVARGYRRMGMRRSAAAWYLRSAWRGRSPSDALRAGAMLLGEGAMKLGNSNGAAPPPQPTWLPLRT